MRVEDWGRVAYAESTERQLALVDQVASGSADERLILCEHPALVTLGRAATEDDLIGWSGEIARTARGGRATYHGPSQVVAYPIINLTTRGRDLHAFLRGIETATLGTLKAMGIPNVRTCDTLPGELSRTGVWAGERKIASIGIAVRRWVTYHGVALNCDEDPEAFTGIRPCGFSFDTMTSVERELGRAVDRATVKSLLGELFSLQFSR